MIVTSSWPLLRMPASRPDAVDDVAVEVDRDAGRADDEAVAAAVDEVVEQPRALRQDLAAVTSAATGGGPIVQAYIFVSKVLAASVARTQNS